MNILKNERIDDLQRTLRDGTELKIIQNPDWFCFGIDAVLLADFADIRDGNTVMDLGTGNGIIPLLVAAKTNASHVDALEIQPDVADMAARSVKLNNLEDKITVITGDIVDYKTNVQYDAVICNPPYKCAETGLVNPNDKQKIARHEVCCNLHEIVKTASSILKPLGRFSVIHRPERLVDIISEMRNYKLEPKRIKYIHSYITKPPVMVMVEGRKYSNPYLSTQPPLVIYKSDGAYTDEVVKIYNKKQDV